MAKKAKATVNVSAAKSKPSKSVSLKSTSVKSTGTRTFRTSIDLSPDTRAGAIALLNARLADCFDLYSQLKQAHWNVKGMDFIQLHELFDEIAESVLVYVDDIAERGVELGGYATGTARMAAATSSLPEYDTSATGGHAHLEAVVERVALFGKLVRDGIQKSNDINDLDTADLFTEISRAMDKHLWFLEAHLQA
jgi:starvation-inducible DNA-binding protein